jgi:tRNA1Val (adenine37-N6)-methyltransferase
MPNPYFRFKQFMVYHDRCAMKVTTDSCVFGAWAAEKMQQSKLKIKNVLDIGSGSGLLSLMLAQKNTARIDAVEIDAECAKQAKENIGVSPWQEMIDVHEANILTFQSLHRYDVVICNPPFYENELASVKQQKNIAHHSEELKISQVLASISKHMNDNAWFFLLIPYKRSNEVGEIIRQNGLFMIESVILKQSVNHEPFRIMIMGANEKTDSANTQVLSIWNEERQYTEGFVSLLKDYYLYL